MVDPATQGEFMLSFVAERHRQRMDEQARGARPRVTRPMGRNRWRKRAMMWAGDLLIDAGGALKARGHLDFPGRPGRQPNGGIAR